MFNNTIFGIIYLIKHKTCDDKKVYVGSTNNLKNRINEHKSTCNNEKSKNYNYKLYQYLRENGGFYMYEIIILEFYICNFKHELHDREDDYIKMYDNNLNSKRAYLTRQEYKKRINKYAKKYYDENKDKFKKYRENNKEYLKKWYENNKEEINEYSKKYYYENKDKVLERSKKNYDENKEKITCECGSIVVKKDITRHRKSLKHIAYIEQKNNVIYN